MNAIPTIDLTGLGMSTEADQRIARDIGAAARGIGFFCVTGHGVPNALVSGMFGAMRTFFARPPAEKQALSIRHSPHNRGYVGLSEEALDPTKGADFKEAFNIGLDLPADHPEVLAGKPFRGMNLWPSDGVFRETALAYFNAQADCAGPGIVARLVRLVPECTAGDIAPPSVSASCDGR
jgi:isopenicillin N synthase-like dioxygenase